MSDTRTKILDSAEQMVRGNGYSGFSFRDIATAVEIKSSSVHHHFATKEVLAREVAQRYMDNFFAALGDATPIGSSTAAQLALYSSVYEAGFNKSRCSCLCGVLSNERALLPASVVEVVDRYVDANILWLSQALAIDDSVADGDAIEEKAKTIFCALQGSMSMAALKQDDQWVRTVSQLISTLILQ